MGDENPWVAARGAFVSVYEDLAKAKRNWQLVGLGLLAVLFVETLALARLALTARVTPYVVEVDRLGRVAALGPVEPLRRTDTRLVVAQLVLFIESVRTVVPSVTGQAQVMRRAYAYADQGAAAYLNAYFADPRNDPRIVGREISRTVDVNSVLPVPGGRDQSWRVQWTETAYPAGDGGGASSGDERTTVWEAYLAVRVSPPATTESIERNPLGVYVTSIAWSRVGAPAGS
jgi:type IV secretory pathway TrbF-like protein